MNKLSNEELLQLQGGDISGAMLSSIVKGINVVLELGKCFGSAIRRIIDKRPCSYQ